VLVELYRDWFNWTG